MTKCFVNTARMFKLKMIGGSLAFALFAIVGLGMPQFILKFDVATVKRAAGGGPPGDVARNMDSSPGSFAMRNVPLRMALEFAYDLKPFQIIGPDWINEERYDVIARAPGPAPNDQMRQMLQA